MTDRQVPIHQLDPALGAGERRYAAIDERGRVAVRRDRYGEETVSITREAMLELVRAHAALVGARVILARLEESEER